MTTARTKQHDDSQNAGPKGKQRRRPRGSAWHWRQTDRWYYTPPGTKKRVPLLDEDGKRIRGRENRKAAELALARVKLAGKWRPTAEPAAEGQWLVAKVCSEYLQYCERGVVNGSISEGYRDEVGRRLNQLCDYCGALPVDQLRKGHVKHWVETHETWRSPVTRRNAIAIVLAAFNHVQDMYDVPNPLKGLKKPPPRPRLHSLSDEEEAAIYKATDEAFGDFLFAAIHTGLRPFCELARITADDVVETARGMMWRVYSSKTKKTRKIPVRREVVNLTRRLMETAPPGSGTPLFRNTRGGCGRRTTTVDGVRQFVVGRPLRPRKFPQLLLRQPPGHVGQFVSEHIEQIRKHQPAHPVVERVLRSQVRAVRADSDRTVLFTCVSAQLIR